MEAHAPNPKSPLSTRSTNTHLLSTNPAAIGADPSTVTCEKELKAATIHSMEYHREVLKEKLENGKKAPGHYISPSDGIMSPCTKKLSDLKGKRFKNAGKPQTLFAKAIGKKSVEKMSASNNEENFSEAEKSQ